MKSVINVALVFLCLLSVVWVLVYKQNIGLQDLPFTVKNEIVCSGDILKYLLRTNDYFPGAGTWKQVKNNTQLPLTEKEWQRLWSGTIQQRCVQHLEQFTSDEWYFPKSCKTEPRFMYKEELTKCVHEKGVKYIVVIGDSNGIKYSLALLSLIRGILNSTCSVQKQAFNGTLTKVVDTHYFLNLDTNQDDLLSKDLIKFTQSIKAFTMARNHTCTRCCERFWKCNYGTNQYTGKGKSSIYLEFLAFDHLDKNLLNVTVFNKGKQATLTYLEYLFRHYLPYRRPDILVIPMPFTHMKNAFTASGLIPFLQDFVNLVHTNLPSTNIYWLPSFRQHEEKLSKDMRDTRYFGKLASEQILDMNNVLFEILRPALEDASSHILSLWDLFEIHDNQTKWVCDGGHMFPVWYVKIMSQLLQVHCSSKNRDY